MEGLEASKHYERLAEDFEEAWFFSADYRPWLVEQMISYLRLTPLDYLCDIGGGTGNFTAAIHNRAKLKKKALVVEPSAAMCAQALKQPELEVVCMDADSFFTKCHISSGPPMEQSADKVTAILMKEVVHHFDSAARLLLFKHMYETLSDGARGLIITRPVVPMFPFFDSALKNFGKGQPKVEIILQEIREDGFETVTLHVLDYPLSIPRERWHKMLRQKFMSNLHPFSDEEIEEGIRELCIKYPDIENYDFVDRLLFIVFEKQCNK